MHSLNMYSYTENNYINRSDSNGVFWFTVFRGLFYGSISGFMTLLGSNNTGKKLIEEVHFWEACSQELFHQHH